MKAHPFQLVTNKLLLDLSKYIPGGRFNPSSLLISCLPCLPSGFTTTTVLELNDVT